MEKPETAHIETIGDLDSPSTFPSDWPLPGRSNDDVATVRSISPLPILLPQKSSTFPSAPSTFQSDWPLPGRSNNDVATVRSISPQPILLPQKCTPQNRDIDHHEIENDWKTLQTLRAHIRVLRSNFEQLSDRLRQVQNKQLEADNIYLSLIRRKQVAGEDHLDQEIGHAFGLLEASRFEYSEVDHACESLREPMNAAELKQMRMEHRFYKNLEKLSRRAPGTEIHWSPPSTTSVSSGRSSRHYGPQKTYHPLWDDYLFKLGVVERLEEEFAELENLKAELEDEKEVRRRIGRSLLSEDDDFLVRYPGEAGKLLASLQTARADVEKAKVTCIEAGVWRDGSSSDEESISDDEYDAPSELSFGGTSPDHGSLGGQDTREDEDEAENLITLERVAECQEQSVIAPRIASSRSPLQFLKTTRNNSLFSDRFVDYIWDKKTTTGNYVNLWLLHKLRASPSIEFGLLRREAEPWRNAIGDSVWQANVIPQWLDDGTSKLPSAIVTDPDSSSTNLQLQHPFLHWNTNNIRYVPKTTAEAIGASLLAEYFNSFIYSSQVQPRGLLFSTTNPSLRQLDFANFFLLENKKDKRQGSEAEKQSGARLA